MSASLAVLFIQPLKEAESRLCLKHFQELAQWASHKVMEVASSAWATEELKADLPGCWKLGALCPCLWRASNKLWCEYGPHKKLLRCQKSRTEVLCSLRPVTN